MSGAGHETVEELTHVANSQSVLKSLRVNDLTHITSDSGQWYVPRSLLQDVSSFFRSELRSSSNKEVHLDFVEDDQFELFLQWLYLRKYQEHEGYALDFEAPKYHYDLDVLESHVPNSIVWCAKPAYLACEVGHRLGAVEFQNYGMKRLFRAYMASGLIAIVTPMMLQQCVQGGEYRMFLENFVVRNWGNTKIVNHQDTGWSTQLEKNERFRTSFALGLAEDKAERSEQPMLVEGYLLDED